MICDRSKLEIYLDKVYEECSEIVELTEFKNICVNKNYIDIVVEPVNKPKGIEDFVELVCLKNLFLIEKFSISNRFKFVLSAKFTRVMEYFETDDFKKLEKCYNSVNAFNL